MAEILGMPINSTTWESGIIAPDGSYLIFTSQRPGGIGRSDLYITFKKEDNSWTTPANMKSINISGIASTTDPTISPDGRFMFFVHYNRTKPGETRDIYWVSTKIIEDMKNKFIE